MFLQGEQPKIAVVKAIADNTSFDPSQLSGEATDLMDAAQWMTHNSARSDLKKRSARKGAGLLRHFLPVRRYSIGGNASCLSVSLNVGQGVSLKVIDID